MFGRKGLQSPSSPPPPQAPEDGRAWAQRHFERSDKPGSMEYAHSIGLKLFDAAYQAMKDERGVRIENIVAMLASAGGHASLSCVLDELAREGRQPQDIGMVVLRGHDGLIYYFGDAPNWLLCEAPHSLVSLLFGAAHERGAPVSIDMLHDEMKRVAQSAGKPDFLDLDLPEQHRVESPLAWAQRCTPFLHATVAPMGTPDFWIPTVVGFALQQAIDVGHGTLDPMTMTRIALQCAVRAAKLDPARVRAA